MQPSRQPAHTPHQVPNPPDPNSNRDTKLLETPLSCTKQTTAYRSNRDKIRVFSLGLFAQFLNLFSAKYLAYPAAPFCLQLLEINPSHTKQGTSFFLIDNFCALFAPLNTIEEQCS